MVKVSLSEQIFALAYCIKNAPDSPDKERLRAAMRTLEWLQRNEMNVRAFAEALNGFPGATVVVKEG